MKDSNDTGAGDRQPRILVVDDDHSLTSLMAQTLSAVGMEVATAADGGEAISQCRQFDPDLVLLDIHMPEMDGISACARIRSQSGNDRLPIVMVTGSDDESSVNRSFNAGATDFISKPINWPLFERRVRAFLEAGKTSAELVESRDRVESLQRLGPDYALIVGRDGRIQNDIGATIAKDCDTIDDLWPRSIAREVRQRIARVLKTREPVLFELADIRSARQFEANVAAEGRDRVLVVMREITEGRASQEEIYELAYSDPVTGLANRYRFDKTVEDHIAVARLEERGLAFLSVSFDGLGHYDADVAGTEFEEVLGEVAQRLVAATDRADSIVQIARLAGNHFVAILTDRDLKQYVVDTGDRIRAAFVEPFEHGNGSVELVPRMGVSVFPGDAQDARSLLKSAVSAMHEAAVTGTPTPLFATSGGDTRIMPGMDLGEELRHALSHEHLEVFWQPRIEMSTGNITSIEALLRWPHALRGYVPLDELLPLAEASGLLVQIGEWVLKTACREACAWQAGNGQGVRVSINLSRQEFFQSDLRERISGALVETGLDASLLEIELTEGSLMRFQQAAADLAKLNDLGVYLTLDDFGTGHTSLFHLKQFPFDALKIDKAFVDGVPGVEDDRAICESVITLAHNLGLKVVAEGVETDAQLEYLVEHGCDELQGYWASEPLPLESLLAYLRDS